MKVKDFDQKFEEGQKDVVGDLDLSTARRVNQEMKQIMDFPQFSGHASITPHEEKNDAKDDHREEDPAL